MTTLLDLFGLTDDEDEVRWQDQALCAQTDPEAFFPETGGSPRPAKAVCVACGVRDECLQAALDANERWGVWGGLTPIERLRLVRRRKLAAADPA